MKIYDAIKYLRINILFDTGGSNTQWDLINENAYGTSQLLWTNEELASYINEAQKKAVRSILGIKDYNAKYNIAVEAGKRDYKLNPKILQIVNATLESNKKELDITDFDDIITNNDNWSLDSGITTKFSVNYQNKTIYLYPTPTVADTIHLFIYRLPEIDVTWDNQELELELQDEYCIPMLWYAAFLAYSKDDSDGGDKSKAAFFKTLFEEEFGSTSVYADFRKARTANRPVKYGGIRMNKW